MDDEGLFGTVLLDCETSSAGVFAGATIRLGAAALASESLASESLAGEEAVLVAEPLDGGSSSRIKPVSSVAGLSAVVLVEPDLSHTVGLGDDAGCAEMELLPKAVRL